MIESLSQFKVKSPFNIGSVAILLMSAVVFFSHPLALLLCVCIFAVLTPTNEFKWLFLVAACALFIVLNICKELGSDLITYVNLQNYVSEKPFFTLFEKNELQLISGTYRVTELGYYAPLWVISKFIPDSKTALSLAATLGVYVPTFAAITLIGKSENWSRGLILTVTLFTFFCGINFLQSNNLIRQYISSSVLFLAFALLISKRTTSAMLLALYACTVHNATALLIPYVAAFMWLSTSGENRPRFFNTVCRGLAIFVSLGVTMVAIVLLSSDFYTEDVPNIRFNHYLLVGALYVLAHIASNVARLRFASLRYARLAFVSIYTLSLAFFLLGLPLLALRYFVYLEWLYGLMVAVIMIAMFSGQKGLILFSRFSLSLAAASILIIRISTAPWMYGASDNDLLSWNFFQVARFVSR